MKFSFKKEEKKKDDEVRGVVARRLGAIKKGEKNEALDKRDLPNLVKDLAHGDG